MDKVNMIRFSADSVQGFKCTAGACEDNCCRNSEWSINVDNDSYEKYKKLNCELGQNILDYIEESPKSGYRFKEFEGGHCPLLSDEGLCLIQRDLGEEYLCRTCMNYPSIWNVFNGKTENWLSFSCPDVVRHVLYKKKKLTYLETTVKLSPYTSPSVPNEAEKDLVRSALIEVVQLSGFSVKEKLIYMGLLMRSFSKLPFDNKFNKSANEIILAYRENMQTTDSLKTLIYNAVNMHPDNRKRFFEILTATAASSSTPPKKIPEGIKNTDYYSRMADFYNDVKNNKTDYLVEAFDRLVVPYVNNNSYVFENYLAYSLVSTKFLVEADNFSEAYAGFAGEFISMLVFTAGLFHKNEAINHDEMIAGIYLFHRKVSHYTELRKSLADAFSNDLLNLLIGAFGGVK